MEPPRTSRKRDHFPQNADPIPSAPVSERFPGPELSRSRTWTRERRDTLRSVTVPPTNTARDAAVDIVRTLRDAGHLAYFAGGCVRDELLGRTPSDYDVATDAVPERVRALFRKTEAVGASFGVILVKHAGQVIEVATFRSDGAYSDARRPDSVRFSSPQEDAARRDFTVNALFLDPLDTAERPAGRLVDYVGGLVDLERRVLKAVGDPEARLREDHLRALRAVRLSGKLGFSIDPRTADAIRRHATALTGVSRERIGDEVRAILESPSRATSIALMHGLGLEESVINLRNRDSGQTPSFQRVRRLSAAASPCAALAAWCEDLCVTLSASEIRPKVTVVRKALCLSNAEDEALTATLNRLTFLRLNWATGSIASRKRQASGPGFADAGEVLTSENQSAATEIIRQVAALANDGIGLAPLPLVVGDDLVAAGFRPGPQFRQVLDRVYDAQLEGTIREKAAAMELAARWFV